MNQLEKKMVNTLKDLKENHHVIGIKAEFEAEGTRLEEALRLKEVVTKAGLELTIKIGGCEAIKDMLDARTIGVNTIVAPMIETDYAMSKFTKAAKFVFPNEEFLDMNFLINVETITGFENINKMVNSPCFKDISGCVLGRVDMTGSMGLTREDINCDKIYDIAHSLSEKMQASNKMMIIGGGVSAHSLPFFSKLPYLTKFETRKVIFDAKKALNDNNADKGILKAVGFELMWLKNKREFMRRALITGASRGIGKSIKQLFEEAGIEVLSPTRAEMDLKSNDSIKQYIDKFNGFDILVNCAGINDLASIEEMTLEKLQEMLQVNLVSQAMLIKYVTPYMKKQKYGRIVNFASIWCDFSKERRIMYSIAKAGVKGLTTATAVELSKYNIMCNAIAPGFINTEMTSQNNTPEQIAQLAEALPIKRMGEPNEIAEFVYFLVSEKNSFMTGQTIFVDGGFSCV